MGPSRTTFQSIVLTREQRFHWVDCQLIELHKCISVTSVRRALRALPPTLDATYDCILTNIDEQYASAAIKVLHGLHFLSVP